MVRSIHYICQGPGFNFQHHMVAYKCNCRSRGSSTCIFHGHLDSHAYVIHTPHLHVFKSEGSRILGATQKHPVLEKLLKKKRKQAKTWNGTQQEVCDVHCTAAWEIQRTGSPGPTEEWGMVRMAHWASWQKERARTSQESLAEALSTASG